MDFSDLTPSSMGSFENSLKSLAAGVARRARREHGGLLPDEDLDALDCCIRKELDEPDLNRSIADVCDILEKACGKKTMILVDEYDHYLQNISANEEYGMLTARMKPFMEKTFKTNPHMRTGVVTGIMPLAKAGMLSSFNNPVACDVFSIEGEELFGFTQEETERLLEDTSNSRHGVLQEIKEWYDGYRFGKAEVYNPYSVMSYLKSLSLGDPSPAKKYWDGSTGGGLSEDLVSGLDGIALQELKSLYNDPKTKIRSPLKRFISYPDLFSENADPSLAYSYLTMAGYLRADPTGDRLDSEDEIYEVGMVNREISPAFKSLVSRAVNRQEEIRVSLKKHILSRDAGAIRDDIQFILGGCAMDKTWQDGKSSVEHNRLVHDRYKDAISGAFRASGMDASEEIPKGFGKCDIFVPRHGGTPAIAVEIKTSSVDTPLESARLARDQVAMMGYAAEPLDGKVVWVALGISGKRAAVITSSGFTPENGS